MRLTTAEARRLAERTMVAAGHDEAEAAAIANHLVDCELRGLSYGGLPRALNVFERMTKRGFSRGAIKVVHETPLSALVHGAGSVGYLVALRAAELAIGKASA